MASTVDDAGGDDDAGTQAPTGAPGSREARAVIARENALPGTSAWQLERPARAHEVEGYASVTSAAAGDRVTLHVSVDKPRLVHYELYRMGYYGGLGGRFIDSSTARALAPQPPCPVDAQTGLVECDWRASFTVSIDPRWVTGQYFFKLITEDGIASYVPLVVREATRHARVLVQSAVATWQAYNVFGGSSLYRNFLPAELGFHADRAYAVSFDRPYTCQDLHASDCRPGSGDFDLGERWLLQWIEQRGLEVAYITSPDLDREREQPDLLQDRDLMIIVGHDEYWSVGEREAVEHARDAGMSLAFLSGNSAYWRIRYAASSGNSPRRTIICYKDRKLDPRHSSSDTTVLFREEPRSQPEQTLLGVMYADAGSRTYFDGFAPVVAQPDHWLFEGTHVRAGDTLAHVVGYEWDSFQASKPGPSGLELVAHAPLFNVRGRTFAHDVSVYYPTDHSVVFAAGSIFWARGLSHPDYRDARIIRMTENLLRRAGVRAPPPGDVPEPERDSSAHHVEVLAGSGADGNQDGPAQDARFGAPLGLARGPDGSLFVTDNTMHAVRRITPQGEVTTLAGCGHSGYVDGVGRGACFRNPSGIVCAPDGSLIVADTENHRLRQIAPDGAVTTYAGSGKAGSDDAADPLDATLDRPRGLALSPDGTLYIADGDSNNLRKLDGGGLTTLTGANQPTAVAVGADGSLYLIATRAGQIQHYSPEQGIRSVAGADGRYGDVDGDAAQARLRPADGLAVDEQEQRVVFTDSANHKLKIWDPMSARVTTVAGDGNARDLQCPRGVLITPDSYIVADTGNHRIVRIVRIRKP